MRLYPAPPRATLRMQTSEPGNSQHAAQARGTWELGQPCMVEQAEAQTVKGTPPGGLMSALLFACFISNPHNTPAQEQLGKLRPPQNRHPSPPLDFCVWFFPFSSSSPSRTPAADSLSNGPSLSHLIKPTLTFIKCVCSSIQRKSQRIDTNMLLLFSSFYIFAFSDSFL